MSATDPRTREPRDSMTLPVVVGARTMKVFFTVAQKAQLFDRIGADECQCLVLTPGLVGIIPSNRVGEVGHHIRRFSTMFDQAETDLPAHWRLWFASRPADLAAGLHYFEFHFGVNGLVALIPSNEEMVAVSPYVM